MFKTTQKSTKFLQDTELSRWGFFWENQKPGGIGLNVSDVKEPWGQAMTLQMQFAFENKEWFVKENPVTPSLIKELKNNLLVGADLIPELCKIKTPSPTDLDRFFSLIYKCFLSYLILLDEGICKEDEYNGFLFIYTD